MNITKHGLSVNIEKASTMAERATSLSNMPLLSRQGYRHASLCPVPA